MFTDVTDLCDSEAEDGDLDLESTAFSDNTDFAERTLARRETFHKHSVQLYSAGAAIRKQRIFTA